MLLNSLLADPAEWYPILFDSPMNIARGICFWATIALALTFLVCVLLIRGEKRAPFLKASLIFFVVYACAVGITLLTFTFLEDGITLTLFAPLVSLIGAIAVSAVLLFVKRCAVTYAISGVLIAGALVASLVCMGIYYESGEAADMNGTTNEEVESVALYISAAVAIVAVLAATFLTGKGDKKGFDTKAISYAAVCIAMSFALASSRCPRAAPSPSLPSCPS